MGYGIKRIDTNKDGRVSRKEYEEFWNIGSKKKSTADLINEDSKFKGVKTAEPKFAMSEMADAKPPKDPSTTALDSLIKQLEAEKDDANREMIKAEIKKQIAEMESNGKQVPHYAMKYAGGKGKSASAFKAQTLGGKALPNEMNPASAKSKMLEMDAPKAEYFSPPESWGNFPEDGKPLSASALLQNTLVQEEYIGNAWDQINRNTKKGKDLMRLFFYYARLAESGDMGAVYQFMKFITYIISKDKAKQQIEMGKKLIQLQELSRKWTNKLLSVQSDSTDSSASSELMKTMTIVKSETDAIATSQKLISQMMEEFSQVVETLTNTTKGALETEGRILRTVSTFR